jgi:hypothetical protein
MPAEHSTRNWTFLFSCLLLIACGLLIRIYDLSDAPLDFHPTRQLHSALMARGMYYQLSGDTAARHAGHPAVETGRTDRTPHPRMADAYAYRAAGSVDLRIPRLIVIVFWLMAAIPLLISHQA